MNLSSTAIVPGSSDALQKLTIEYEVGSAQKYTGTVSAMFNPSQLKFSKEMTWEFSPVAGQQTRAGYHVLSFRESKPKTLSVDLFFDTYEGPPSQAASGLAAQLKGQALKTLASLDPRTPAISGVDVRAYTSKVAKLAYLDQDLHRPPRCRLRWGKFTLIETCVLTSLSEDYTFFLADGTPVRATLSCHFTEVLQKGSGPELWSADVAKTWVIKSGDTLTGIAQVVYGDASRWRLIAQANGIDDPRRLAAGRMLTIPPLPANR